MFRSSNNKLYTQIQIKFEAAVDYISQILDYDADYAIVAGSGFADYFRDHNILGKVKYSDIPNMPETSVAGHCGELHLIEIGGKNCYLFSGRFHLYEGRDVEEICSIAIISQLLGVKIMLFTNAAGGLNPRFEVGDPMIINDTINLLYKSEAKLFVDNSPVEIFSSELLLKWKQQLIENAISFNEGVYLSTCGPSYETPSEIRLFRALGADAAGMSTVLEAATASKLGIKCLGLSLITNLLSEVDTLQLSHNDVIEASQKSSDKIRKIIELFVNV